VAGSAYHRLIVSPTKMLPPLAELVHHDDRRQEDEHQQRSCPHR
jgi:hypothetical protein